jgi:hypothetical protein
MNKRASGRGDMPGPDRVLFALLVVAAASFLLTVTWLLR